MRGLGPDVVSVVRPIGYKFRFYFTPVFNRTCYRVESLFYHFIYLDYQKMIHL